MEQLTVKENIESLGLKKSFELIKNQLDDSKNILNTANLLRENKFVFTRTWDMEPCHTPYEVKPLNWLANPNGDDEWTFMLNRFGYLEYLVMASILTGDIKYIEHGKYLMLDWIVSHPEITLNNSTRTLDTAMRIDSWINAMVYLDRFKLLSVEDYKQIENSIINQIVYMKDNYIPKYTLSNWGSIQTAVIIRVIPMLSDFKRKEEIFNWAVEEFETQMKLQVYDNGLHWEQSIMYHAEVLHYSLKLVYMKSYPMSSNVKDIIYSMANALLYQMTPRGTIEAFGDSDISNVIPLLNLCAVTFKEERFKVNNCALSSIENLYEMNKAQIECYANLSSNLVNDFNFDGFDSGMFTSRSSWSDDANFTLFSNGTMGSGHAHADNNHLSIYYKGKGIIIDSGRYTYREDDPRRIYLKSSQAHSSVIVDKVAGSIPNSSWTYESYIKPIANRVKHKNRFHFYQGTTLSRAIPHFYTHTRKIIISDDGVWLVLDDIEAEGKHSLQTFFNIEPSVSVELTDQIVNLNNLKFISLDEELKLNDQIYSPLYNHIERNKQIELKSTFNNRSITSKLFMNKKFTYKQVDILRDNKEVIDNDFGMAIKIRINQEYSITFIIIHDELYNGRKNLVCEGVTFHAKALVIEEKKNNKEVYILST
ncbi:MAG: heparinase II/III family protein [Staphylococcus equorum]|uniref:Heparinase II/III N-terminus n=2 Tax=Alkalibacterium gilvum TaxID=1130080 RepID=A0A1H6VVQ3_9LACT|nr:alginate lyase family protein [Alkalibacterium gilvum]MDN6294369.1 heparinase II/III family protein [Alkalibacterium sp.]MDN6741930.1 heparinase II/III family protein [Staphylococcus equorum]SEJ04710.1 Heparinase II/III N-terminus [Alkalibacterium gilvum]